MIYEITVRIRLEAPDEDKAGAALHAMLEADLFSADAGMVAFTIEPDSFKPVDGVAA